MRKKINILCPLPRQYKDAPDHLLYGSKSFVKVAKASYGVDADVNYLYINGDGGIVKVISDTLTILWAVLTTKHDALYYCTDPKCLFLLSFLRTLKLYSKPMFAWKYIAIKKSGNVLSNLVKKVMYSGFDKIFMMTEKHVSESEQDGLVKTGQLVFLKWGEDLSFVDGLTNKKEDKYTFISTGKAYRDFDTLLKAFDKVENAKLILYLPTSWGNFHYANDFQDCSKNPNVEAIIVGGGHNKTLTEIFLDLKRAHCSLCICHPVNFGVGYTQVLDSMACGLPVILTENKDNPIDVKQMNAGLTVPAGDVDALANAMNRLVNEEGLSDSFGKNAYSLVKNEYNIEIVAKNVLSYII